MAPDPTLESILKTVFAEAAAAKRSASEAISLSVDYDEAISPAMADDLTDVKIALSEARTDTKFAELRADISREVGEVKTLLAGKPGTGTLIGIAVALFAAILGALAFGGDRLALGVGLADSRVEQIQRDKAQDERFEEILRRLPTTEPAVPPKK